MKKHIKVVCSNINNEMIEMKTYLDESIIHSILRLNDGSPIIERNGEWGAAVLKNLGDDEVDLGPILAKIMSKLTYVEEIEGLNSWSFTVEEDVNVDNSMLIFSYEIDTILAKLKIAFDDTIVYFRLHRRKDNKWSFSDGPKLFEKLETFSYKTGISRDLIMNCLIHSLNEFNERQISPFIFVHDLNKVLP